MIKPAQPLSTYRPRGAARRLFGLRDKSILMEGPARTGKTRGVLEKLNAVLCKYAGARALIVRKTKASLAETVLQTFEDFVLPDNTALYPAKDEVKRENRKVYRYPNGSLAVVGGLDNPARIMSSEYNIICLFEGTDATESDYEYLLSRLSNETPGMDYRQMIVDCNPSAPSHWLNRRAESGGMSRLLSRHEDNPVLWDESLPKLETDDPDAPEYRIPGNWTALGREFVLGTLESMTGARRDRLRFGLWRQAEGVVYESYDPHRHLLTAQNAPASMLVAIEDGEAKLVIPKTWKRYRSIDFGYNDPFVCQWWAVDEDGRAYMYRELFGVGRLVEDWARLIVELSAGEKIEATVADHDREGRATLEKYGVPTVPAMKAIESGIQAVQARLRVAGDGRPRLYLLEDALEERDAYLAEKNAPLSTAQEFGAYSYKQEKDGRITKETPVDKFNHGMDAMRYMIAHLDNVGREPVIIRVIGEGNGSSRPAATRRTTDDDLWTNL